MVIDVHAHAVLEGTLGCAGPHGPELSQDEDGRPVFRAGDYVLHGVRYQGSPFMDVDLRLAAMDQAGIDLQVLSPNPLTYFHHVDSEIAAAFCRRHNDEMARLVAEHPGRLRGFAALPMQDVRCSVDELRRSVDLGLVGPYIGTSVGRALDDPVLDELYDAVVEAGLPLFLHPEPPGTHLAPFDSRLGRFDLDLMLGFAYEETLAVATLVYGGVLDRHPGLDVCISHGGGALAFLAGRLGHASHVRPWAPTHLAADGSFEEALRRLWYDCHVHDPRSLQLLADVVGSDRLVFGTNFAGWDQGTTTAIGELGAQLEHNARRLLRF